MTKKQYLAKLRKYLQFRLSNSEIADILSDMEECSRQVRQRENQRRKFP